MGNGCPLKLCESSLDKMTIRRMAAGGICQLPNGHWGQKKFEGRKEVSGTIRFCPFASRPNGQRKEGAKEWPVGRINGLAREAGNF